MRRALVLPEAWWRKGLEVEIRGLVEEELRQDIRCRGSEEDSVAKVSGGKDVARLVGCRAGDRDGDATASICPLRGKTEAGDQVPMQSIRYGAWRVAEEV